MISNNVVTFTPSDPKNIVNLVGINDANLKLLEETYDISIVENGNTIQLSGDESTV
ncbi:MAG: phosphate starvation-inducible protein PhoH, partial [Lactobacillus iners]|nr:phosphate starvation-inducible protein PhoH [Lactobacillus iners]